jgi:RHS repeat-associated protein
VVVDASGTVKQVTHYYPFGGFFGESTGSSYQAYKYNGKEFERLINEDWYDYGARHMDGMRFTTMDPMAEKYYSISPYVYCGNNPVIRLDQDGKVWETVWDIANIVYDIGAAIVNHAIGDHEEAIENWEDAGFDLLAAAIPFVPAGTSKVINGAKSIEKTARGSTRQNVTKVFSSRKKALDARPKPHPIKPKQRRITHQTKNKKGEGKKFKTDKGSQTPHVHDDNHNNINKKNVHYRVGKKKIKKL